MACFRPRPAPLIAGDRVDDRRRSVSIEPGLRRSGASASVAAVTWQPGVATSRAPFELGCGAARAGRTRPRPSSSGWSCSKPYHVGYSDGVLQPVGRREVDDAADLADQLRRQRHRSPRAAARGTRRRGRRRAPASNSSKHEVRVGGRRGSGTASPAGVPAWRVAGGVDDLEVGVLGAQAQQLGARVARRADDPDARTIDA